MNEKKVFIFVFVDILRYLVFIYQHIFLSHLGYEMIISNIKSFSYCIALWRNSKEIIKSLDEYT